MAGAFPRGCVALPCDDLGWHWALDGGRINSVDQLLRMAIGFLNKVRKTAPFTKHNSAVADSAVKQACFPVRLQKQYQTSWGARVTRAKMGATNNPNS